MISFYSMYGLWLAVYSLVDRRLLLRVPVRAFKHTIANAVELGVRGLHGEYHLCHWSNSNSTQRRAAP
jgi:hypothetical protein